MPAESTTPTCSTASTAVAQANPSLVSLERSTLAAVQPPMAQLDSSKQSNGGCDAIFVIFEVLLHSMLSFSLTAAAAATALPNGSLRQRNP